MVKRQPAITSFYRRWAPEVEDALIDCFYRMDWDVLLSPHGEDIERMTLFLTDYLNFCVDLVSPIKTVQCYPNNKPWVMQEVKSALNRKKVTFWKKDREAMKTEEEEETPVDVLSVTNYWTSSMLMV